MTTNPAGSNAPVQASTANAALEDEIKRVELQVRLATAQASLRTVQQPDPSLPTLPDVTARVPTISDKGGSSAVILAAANVLGGAVPSIVAAVRMASQVNETIVVIDDPRVSASQVLAYDLKARTSLLAAELKRVEDDQSWDKRIAVPDAISEAAGGRRAITAVGGGAAAATLTPTPAGPAAGQVLRFAVDLLDAISPTTTLAGRDVALTNTALRAEVAGQLASGVGVDCRTVIVPDQAAILGSDSYTSARDLAISAERVRAKLLAAHAALAAVTTRLAVLRAKVDAVDKLHSEAVADPKNGDAGALGKLGAGLLNDIRNLQQLEAYRTLSALAAEAAALLETVDAYLVYISTRVDGVSPLQRATLAELICGPLPLDAGLSVASPRQDRYLLHLDVAMTAGDVLTTSSLFDTSIKASASVQVVYQLTTLAGHVLAAGDLHGCDLVDVVKGLHPRDRALVNLLAAALIVTIVASAVVLVVNAIT